MKVLIADDSATNRLLMSTLVGEFGCETVEVASGDAALSALEEPDGPRLALLDWLMPGLDGIDVCRRVRARKTDTPPYLILVTGLDEKHYVVDGLDAGADDFITKPFHAREFLARLQVGLRFVELTDRLLVAYQDLEMLASTDVLTGVPNRRVIVARLEEEVRRAARERGELSIGLLDVDHFKHVNDTFGHATGDAVLREIVRRASAALRPYDSIGRFGGEEFLIVMPRTGDLDVAGVLNRVRAAVAATPMGIGARDLPVTVSIGGATGAEMTVDELIAQADEALYEAKDAGRDRVVAGRPVELKVLITDFAKVG